MSKKIKVTAPDGTSYLITAPESASADEINSYVETYLKKTPKDESQKILAQEIPEEPTVNPLQTVAHSMAPIGLTSAVYGAKEAAPQAMSGKFKGALDTYRQQRDFARQALLESQKQNPRAAIAGQLIPGLAAGAMGATMEIPTIAALGGAQAAIDSSADITKLNDPEQRKRLAKDVGIGIGMGGTLGALGTYAPKSMGAAALGGLTGQVIDPSGEGAILGASLGLGARASMNPALRGYLAKKTGNILFNVGDDISDAYLKNSTQINEQRSKEEIYDEILNFVNSKRDNVAQAKEVLESAKLAQRDLKQNLERELQLERYNLEQQAAKKSDDVKNYVNATINEKKSVPNTLSLADQAVSGTDALQTLVNDLSKQSYQILEDDNVQIPIKKLILMASKIKKERAIGNSGGVYTLEDKKGVEALDRQLQTFLELLKSNKNTASSGVDAPKSSESLTGAQLKKILQSLGSEIDYSAGAGEYTGSANQMLSRFRADLNEELKKQSPQYRQLMEVQLAPLTRLLSESSKLFKNNSKALSSTNTITAPVNATKRDTLVRLGKETGIDFETPLTNYESAQRFLTDKSQVENLRVNSKEYQELIALQNKLNEMNVPGYNKNRVKTQLIDSEENAALQNAVKNLQEAQKNLKPYESLRPASLETTLNAATRERINPSRTIKRVGDELGKDYGQELENLRVKQALATGKPQGSRNAVVGAGIGAGLGTSIGGGVGGAIGAATGAGFGGFVDKYAGPMTKRVLDGELAIRRLQNSPTAQKFIPVIESAMRRGSVAATLYLLGQTSPEFREAVKDKE